MTIDPAILRKIKTSIRIQHTKLDGEIEDTIRAALADLGISGVDEPPTEDPQDMDPLILNAIKLYCKAEYTDDPAKSAEFRSRYDKLKSHLMMAEGYSWTEDTDE